MKKKLSYVPWDFVWMPIIAVLLILWSASVELPGPVIWAAVLVAAAALVLDLWPQKPDRDRLEMRLLWNACFPVYYSSILACVILLLGGTDPEQTQIFALTITLIGVAISLLVVIWLLNRNRKALQKIVEDMADLKKKTAIPDVESRNCLLRNPSDSATI